MEFEQILALIDRVSSSKLTSFEFEEGNLKLSMELGALPNLTVRGTDVPLQAMESADDEKKNEGSVAIEEEQRGDLVRSILVGTFYTAPAEDARPFVKPGDRVKKGQVLAIIEAMKLMNEVESDFDGEVAEVLVKNGEAVEYGQPLFRII